MDKYNNQIEGLIAKQNELLSSIKLDKARGNENEIKAKEEKIEKINEEIEDIRLQGANAVSNYKSTFEK